MFTLPRTAIFPVAGRGTRMLPATRAMPKELLPVLDRPLLDFAVDEAVDAGIRRLVFVTHPDKAEIRRYITRRPDLPSDLDIVFVEQDEARGLGSHYSSYLRELFDALFLAINYDFVPNFN